MEPLLPSLKKGECSGDRRGDRKGGRAGTKQRKPQRASVSTKAWGAVVWGQYRRARRVPSRLLTLRQVYRRGTNGTPSTPGRRTVERG